MYYLVQILRETYLFLDTHDMMKEDMFPGTTHRLKLREFGHRIRGDFLF